MWILIGVVIVVIVFALIAFSGSSLRSIDAEATQEARHASDAHLDEVLHPPPKTAKEVEEDNELYEER